MRLLSVLRSAPACAVLAALALCATVTALRAQSAVSPGKPADGQGMAPSASEQAGSDFYAAAGAFDLPLMKVLLQKGADVNYGYHETGVGGGVETPLLYAARSDYSPALFATGLATIKFLVQHGANVNASDHGWTALHFAAANGRADVVAYLLQHGAKVNALNGRNETPLDYALKAGHADVASVLTAYHGRASARVAAKRNGGGAQQGDPSIPRQPGDRVFVSYWDRAKTECQYFLLHRDGTFSMKSVGTTNGGIPSYDYDSGFFDIAGNRLTIHEGGRDYLALYSGTSITFPVGGTVYRIAK